MWRYVDLVSVRLGDKFGADSVGPVWRSAWRFWRRDDVTDLARRCGEDIVETVWRVSRKFWPELFSEILLGVEPVWREIW